MTTPRHLFVIRMWQEADAVTATVQWRGSVQHMLSPECHYFVRLSDLFTFITDRTEGASVALPPLPATEGRSVD